MTVMDPADVFRQEASELFGVLEEALLDLIKRPNDRELIDSAFRALHTIKGSGAMFGFEDVAAFTHEFETVFDLVRKGEIPVTENLISVALSAKDYIRALVEAPDGADLIIGEAILGDLAHLTQITDQHDLDAVSRPGVIDLADERHQGWRIDIEFDQQILCNGSNPLDYLDDLRKLGPCFAEAFTDNIPPLDALEPENCYLRWTVRLLGVCDKADIEDIFMFVRDEMKLGIEPILVDEEEGISSVTPSPADNTSLSSESEPPTSTPEAKAAVAEQRVDNMRSEGKSAATVRVQAERLDELMDRVGELVIAQARLSQIAAGSDDPSIKVVAEEIERLSGSLRDTAMGARMVPIGSLFGRFRRLIHDLSRDLGKPIEFVAVGEDTKLDKTMIESLADPLVHLIRNAIDHGIEDPTTRAAVGKSETGRIDLIAAHSGAQVLVKIRDNGAGLNTERIRAKAEEQGLIVPGVSATDSEIQQFLFHPGFSTANTISALSGRGVGMDVVKRAIEAMRGTIDVATEPGNGTTVTLSLPLTLAIIEGLLIQVADGRYIIPLSAVEECVELPPTDERARDRNFLNVRGELVPFLRLRTLFAASGSADRYQKVIIISTGDTRVGLVADQIIGNHQTVIKSMSKLHADVTMFSGATILGDGSAALILDVAQMVAIAQQETEKLKMNEAA